MSAWQLAEDSELTLASLETGSPKGRAPNKAPVPFSVKIAHPEIKGNIFVSINSIKKFICEELQGGITSRVVRALCRAGCVQPFRS